jgi:hypothetical protein
MDKLKINPGLAISDNGFLFQSSTGETFTANLIGVKILNELKADRSVEEIKKLLLDEYDVEEDRLEKDLNDFLTQLKSFNLTELS